MQFYYFIFKIILIFSIFLPLVTFSYRQVVPHKQWYRYPGNPGLKIRITKKGANHIKTVGVQIFNDYISKLKDYSTSVPFSQIGLNGVVTLKGLHVKNYHPPQLSVLNFLPPRHIILGLENLDISLGSQFEASSPPIKFEGSLDGSIVGMTIALTTEMLTDVNGRMNAIVRNCSAVINRSHVTLNPTGPMAIFVKTFEPIINDSVRQRMPEILCSRLQNMIERNLAKIFDQIMKIDLKDYFPSGEDGEEKDVMKAFIHQFTKGMFVDNRMMLQPSVTMEYFETSHLGEVRFDNLNSSYSQIPFYPWPMDYQSNLPQSLNGDHMAHFFVSDHLLNSMLYHAYQDNRLSIKIDESNLPSELSGLMSTTCQTRNHPISICVGNLIPQIGKTYPNATTSFVILPHGLPYVMFNRDATTVEITNRILTYVEPENQSRNIKSQILVFSVNGQADIRFSPTNESLNARLDLNRFNVRLHRSAVRGIDESSISRLEPLTKTFISPRLNEAFEKALRFPMQETMKFVNPTITNYDGFIVMSTDFKLDKERLQETVKKSLDQF